MSFLNTSLLLGLIAVAIPIALHLIARKEPKQVVFPSVLLLTQRFQTNRSKVNVRRWWLLALRIAALATLALALARPTISGTLSLTWSTIGIIGAAGVGLLALASAVAAKPDQKTLMWSLLVAALLSIAAAIGWGGYTLASGEKPNIDQSTPVALAIVVDNSAISGWKKSTDWKASSGLTSDSTDPTKDHLQTLHEVATQLISVANLESRFAVIDRSSTPATFALDAAGAISKANQIQALEIAQPLESRIEAAARLLSTSDIESRQLVLVSGLAKSSFADQDTSRSLAELTEELGVSVTVWDAGEFKGLNRVLSAATLSNASPAPETSVTVAATLALDASAMSIVSSKEAASAPRNTPEEIVETTAECVLFPSNPALPVVRDGQIIRPDAKPVDRISVELTAGRNAELKMTLPPLPIGLHHGAIRLIGADALAIDDTSYFTVDVSRQSRVLLVGDQVEEANFIRRAISTTADASASQFDVQRVGYDDLSASRAEDFDGIVLLDPPVSALDEPELVRYLRLGGNVLLVAGQNLGQERVAVDGFPVLERPWRATDPGTFLEITSPSHPALAMLSSIEGGVPFSDFRVFQYWQIDKDDSSQILMRFAGTGHPALLERRLGGDEDVTEDAITNSGRLLLLTTPLPELANPLKSWNELFSAEEPWPALLLVREVTRYLTDRSTQRWTSPVGSPVTIPLRRASVNTADGSVPSVRRLQWFPPIGSTPIPVDAPVVSLVENETSTPNNLFSPNSATRVVIGTPKHSGVHWVRGDLPGLGFTVNATRDALETERVNEEQLESLFGSDQYRLIESLDEMNWTAGDAAKSMPLWSPIMLVALVVFLLEQILSNRFYKTATNRNSGVATQPNTTQNSGRQTA